MGVEEVILEALKEQVTIEVTQKIQQQMQQQAQQQAIEAVKKMLQHGLSDELIMNIQAVDKAFIEEVRKTTQ